ncbi:MAG: PDZ domain-containing protein [Spirochaetia bacterium]|jgi:S1-C subfamily serine protease
MTHRTLFSSRTFFAGLLFAALTVGLGFAQQKADSKGTAAVPTPAADAGVLVVAVQPGSPAEKAGIARGDIILEANGTVVNDAAELRQAIAGRAAGDTLSVKLRHGDAMKTLTVTVGAKEGRPWIGVLPLRGRGPGMMGSEDFGYGMRGFDDHGPMFPAEGALVGSVTAGSPAEKAGLKKGDLILSVDGTTVDERNQLAALVSAKKVGDTITLSVASWGQETPHDVKVTLEKNPDKDAPFLGVQYMPAPPRFGGGRMGPGTMSGALVLNVTAGGPAARAGIQPRDVVTKVDGTAVTAAPQVVDAVGKHKPGDTIAITVFRRTDGKQTDLTVTLAHNPKDAGKAWLGISMSDGFGGSPGMPGEPRTPPSTGSADTPTL